MASTAASPFPYLPSFHSPDLDLLLFYSLSIVLLPFSLPSLPSLFPLSSLSLFPIPISTPILLPLLLLTSLLASVQASNPVLHNFATSKERHAVPDSVVVGRLRLSILISLICWWVSNNHHPSNTLAAPHKDPKSEEEAAAKRSWSSWKPCSVLFFLLPQAPILPALGRPCAVTFIPNFLFFIPFYFHFHFRVSLSSSFSTP